MTLEACSAPLLKKILTFSLLASLSANVAASVVIVGNTLPGDDTSGFVVNNTASQAAVSFTMPASDYQVDSVLLRLALYTTSTDTAAIRFYGDSGDKPNTGDLIGSLSNPSSASSASGTFTFTPSGSITLAANTKYWLVVDATAGNFYWHSSGSAVNPISSAIGATPGVVKTSSDNGVTYPTTLVNNTVFEVQGTQLVAVPEPMAYASFSAVGLLAFALYRRIKR